MTDTTERVTARIGVIQEPVTFIAVLDGRGESTNQQFEVAEKSDILLVLLDHNDIDTNHPNQERMGAHVKFGNQLRDYLTAHPRSGRRIHILLNKKDKWEKATDDQQKGLQDFFAGEVAKWRTAFGAEVTSAEHSNDSSPDIGALVKQINSHWKRYEEIVGTQAR